jgi:hypothetical protein
VERGERRGQNRVVGRVEKVKAQYMYV